MSRASRRDNSVSTSLFPFLAVLLCTMGVLVVLLVVMASVQLNQAELKRHAAAKHADATHDSPEQQQLRSELAEIEELQAKTDSVRDEALRRLRDEKLRLSQIEENIRRRQERLALLRVEIEELQSLDGQAADDLKQARERLERQQRLIAETQADVEKLRDQERQQDKHFAIIPYHGTQGTRRRPIYIECRHDSVIIQPENIVLTPEDFNRVAPAGAPLPAAIRAAQRYYIDRGLADEEQPYPLVLIRPDASMSFSHVARMLEDVHFNYGYELVAADWTFDYSATNPHLSDEMQRAVDDARQMLDGLRTAAPDAFAANSVEDFDAGPSLLELVKSGRLAVDHSSSQGGRVAGHKRQAVVNDGPVDLQRLAGVMQEAITASTSEVALPALQEGSWKIGSEGSGEAGTVGGSSHSLRQFSERDPQGGQPSLTHQRPSLAANAATPPTDGNNNTQNATSSQSATLHTASTASASPNPPDPTDQPHAAAPEAPLQPMSATSPEASPSTMAGNTASASMGSTVPDGFAETAAAPQNKKAPPPGTAVIRTIRVHVGSKQLQVGSTKSAALIQLGENSKGSGKQAATRFLKAIQAEVLDWGIAGDGLYWKAVLQMTVAPGGEEIAQKLAETLRDSGIEVQLEYVANDHRPITK